MNTAVDIRKTVEPKSDQLNFDDLIDSTKDITVTEVRLMKSDDQPVAVHYEGDDGRPFKPCKSMRRVLIALWGPRADKWAGRSMRLYGDPSVKFGGSAVGGIRISHMTDIEGEKSLMLTVTRARRAEYKVKPMDAPKRKPLADDVFNDKLPAIKALIEDGKSTPEQAITNLQKHYGEPSKEQREQIRALGGGE
jgi:hypothetical protein